MAATKLAPGVPAAMGLDGLIYTEAARPSLKEQGQTSRLARRRLARATPGELFNTQSDRRREGRAIDDLRGGDKIACHGARAARPRSWRSTRPRQTNPIDSVGPGGDCRAAPAPTDQRHYSALAQPPMGFAVAAQLKPLVGCPRGIALIDGRPGRSVGRTPPNGVARRLAVTSLRGASFL
jgi:hypothetical protein